jgi:hypothetical protein
MEAMAYRCPTCGSTALQPGPEGTLTCVRCGTVCEVAQPTCPECGAANPPGAERCHACDRLLDLVGFVLRARLQGPSQRLEQDRQRAAALKQEAEAASQDRMRQWWEQEEERRRAVALAQVEQKRQEQRLLAVAMAIAFVVLTGVVIYLLVSAGGSGGSMVTPTPFP